MKIRVIDLSKFLLFLFLEERVPLVNECAWWIDSVKHILWVLSKWCESSTYITHSLSHKANFPSVTHFYFLSWKNKKKEISLERFFLWPGCRQSGMRNVSQCESIFFFSLISNKIRWRVGVKRKNQAISWRHSHIHIFTLSARNFYSKKNLSTDQQTRKKKKREKLSTLISASLWATVTMKMPRGHAIFFLATNEYSSSVLIYIHCSKHGCAHILLFCVREQSGWIFFLPKSQLKWWNVGSEKDCAKPALFIFLSVRGML